LNFIKEKLEKALLDRADAISRSKSLESSLQITQTEIKRLEEQNDQYKQEAQNLVQSIDDQRSLLTELETKFQVNQSIVYFFESNSLFSSRIVSIVQQI